MVKLKTEIPEILRDYCEPEWHPVIAENIRQLAYKKGECIFKENQDLTHMLFIQTGRAKVVAAYGKEEKIIRFAKDQDILGHRGLGAELVLPVSAYALEPVKVLAIPISVFLNLLKTNVRLTAYLLEFFADELRNSEMDARRTITASVKERVGHSILYAAKVFGYSEKESGLLAYSPRRAELSSMAGTTYESVIRILADFQRDGLVLMKGKQFFIPDEEKLKKALETV